jgi:hypothetical protein
MNDTRSVDYARSANAARSANDIYMGLMMNMKRFYEMEIIRYV